MKGEVVKVDLTVKTFSYCMLTAGLVSTAPVLPEYMAGYRWCHKTCVASSDLIFNAHREDFPPSESITSNWKKKKKYISEWNSALNLFILSSHRKWLDIQISKPCPLKGKTFHCSISPANKKARCVEMSYRVYHPKISKHFFFYHITPSNPYLQQILLYYTKVSWKQNNVGCEGRIKNHTGTIAGSSCFMAILET